MNPRDWRRQLVGYECPPCATLPPLTHGPPRCITQLDRLAGYFFTCTSSSPSILLSEAISLSLLIASSLIRDAAVHSPRFSYCTL